MVREALQESVLVDLADEEWHTRGAEEVQGGDEPGVVRKVRGAAGDGWGDEARQERRRTRRLLGGRSPVGGGDRGCLLLLL